MYKKLLITGDVSSWNIDDFCVDKITNNVFEKIKESTYFISNLEGPILNSDKKYEPRYRSNYFLNFFYKSLVNIARKEQPIVFSDPKIIDLFKISENALITLANNHIKDGGREGIRSTLRYLDDNFINSIGAGCDLVSANNHFLIDDKIVIININLISSRKYNIPFMLYNATKTDFGASYLNFADLKKRIDKERSENRIVILLIHGGNELPKNYEEIGINLELVKSVNADLTVIHHSHLYIKTKYEDDNIFLLGDFIFNRPNYLDSNRETAVLDVKYDENNFDLNLMPMKVKEIYNYDE